MSKRLTVTNGEVRDAGPYCEDCDKRLLPSHNYCPYCGDEL